MMRDFGHSRRTARPLTNAAERLYSAWAALCVSVSLYGCGARQLAGDLAHLLAAGETSISPFVEFFQISQAICRQLLGIT